MLTVLIIGKAVYYGFLLYAQTTVNLWITVHGCN